MRGWKRFIESIKDFFFSIPRIVVINSYKLVVRIRVFNRQRLPEGKPFILAINHVTGADPLIILGGIKKKITFLAGSGNFTNVVSNFFMRRCANAVPVFKEKTIKNVNTFKEIFDISKDTKTVFGIFPEGSLNKKDGFKKFHKGVAYLSYKMKMPILPVYISDIRKGFGKNRLLGRFVVLEGISAIFLNFFNKVNVFIGNPIDPIAENIIKDFRDLKDKTSIKEMTEDINDALSDEFLSLKQEADEYSSRHLKPRSANMDVDLELDDRMIDDLDDLGITDN